MATPGDVGLVNHMRMSEDDSDCSPGAPTMPEIDFDVHRIVSRLMPLLQGPGRE